MRRFSKGFAFVPLLIVFFLLVVSAVTSYVVINQGTGGYSSRAQDSSAITSVSRTVFGTPYSCKRIDCEKWVNNNNTPYVNQGPNSRSALCASQTDSAGRSVCNWADGATPQCNVSGANYRNRSTSYGQISMTILDGTHEDSENIAYFNCSTSTTVTPTTSCGSATTSPACSVNSSKCIWDSAHSVCKDKIAEGQRCLLLSSAVPCQSGLTCVDDPNSTATANGLCKKSITPTPTKKPTVTDPKPSVTPVPGNSCSTGVGNTCGYLRKAGCPDGVVFCTTGNTCIDSTTGTAPIEFKTGKCVAKPTDPKPSATPEPNNPPPYNPPPSNLTCAGGILCDGTPVTGTAGQTVCGQKDSSGTCRTSQCNGSTGQWSYVGAACTLPVVTTSVTPSAGTGTTGDVTLNFTLRLQGVTAQPKGGQTVPFKVKLKGPSTKDYVSGTLTANSVGKWTGSVAFTGISVGTDTKYTIYVKVGKHLQKRVCGFAPTETSGGLYNCTDSAIPLSAGANNLDFSGIMLLAGDLPSSTGEQNGVVDSYDISYILNNLGETDSTKMAIGDLNFDGVIDTQDRSLIIQSLNVKYDDQ